LVQVNEDPSGLNYQTNYAHDVLGNLVRVRQGGVPQAGSGNVIQTRAFLYDSLSRLIYANNPEQDATIPGPSGTRWTMKYEYDNNGNLIKRTDARNIITAYSYDALNRNTKACYSDSTLPVFRYYDPNIANGKGRLWKVENHASCDPTSPATKSGTVANSYDALGRITSQSQQFQKSDNTWFTFPAITRTYDLAGHLATQTYPSGNLIANTFNVAGRLTQFYGTLGFPSGAAYAKQITYNAAGQMIKEAFDTSPEPLYHNIAYNSRFQMVENRLGATPNDPETWSRGKLVFDYGTTSNNGNILRQEHYVPTSVTPNTPTSPSAVLGYVIPMRDDYEYDPLNRLKKVTGKQFDGSAESQIYTQAFTYDPFGNRKIDAANTGGAGINDRVYEVNKRSNRLSGLVYDAAGNVINESYTSRLNDRKYDAENRMTQANAVNYYVYDGDGRRVRRIVNGVETWQVYGIDGELLAEYAAGAAATSPQKEYGYRGGQLLITAEPAGQVKWLVSDHLGTPRIIVDSTGHLSRVRRHDYLPFGEELTPAMAGGGLRSGGNGYTADTVRQQFGEKERDNETGLDFFLARFYSSVQGRFNSPDLAFVDQLGGDPQSWNLYSYVRNNPCAHTDPSGRETCYYSQNGGSKIGCEGDSRIRIEDGKLIFTPRKGAEPVVYDLNQVDAKFIVTPGPPTIDDLAFEMNRRAPALKQAIGVAAIPYVAAGLGTGGAAIMGIGGAGGAAVTTLGLSEGGTAGEFAVIGARQAVSIFNTLSNARVLIVPRSVWNLNYNLQWVQNIIAARLPVYLASPLVQRYLVRDGSPTVFAQEVQLLLNAGYRQFGNWLIPPGR